jgi:hypothetical protein
MATQFRGDLKVALAHVLWIGGATDSGKTSVARALAQQYGLQAYHLDRYDREEPPGHWSRTDPVRHPHMHASPTRDRDWMWVHTTPEELAERWFRWAPERFQLVLEDLLGLPPAPPIVAEGYGLTPDLVLPLLASTSQAFWLVSTEEFKRASDARRGKQAGKDTSDPERARRNHVGRDLLLAQHVRRRAEALGLPVVEVDGSRSLAAIVALVEAHFAPLLQSASVTARCGG